MPECKDEKRSKTNVEITLGKYRWEKPFHFLQTKQKLQVHEIKG